jgi:hypothetical protein
MRGRGAIRRLSGATDSAAALSDGPDVMMMRRDGSSIWSPRRRRKMGQH